MRKSSWTPTIVPYGADQTVYLVIDSFGGLGSVYREAEVERTDLETIITDLMAGQFNDPIRVVAFNTLEHWAQDVSGDIAEEIQTRSATSKARASLSTSKALWPATPVRPGSWHCGWFDPKWLGRKRA